MFAILCSRITCSSNSGRFCECFYYVWLHVFHKDKGIFKWHSIKKSKFDELILLLNISQSTIVSVQNKFKCFLLVLTPTRWWPLPRMPMQQLMVRSKFPSSLASVWYIASYSLIDIAKQNFTNEIVRMKILWIHDNLTMKTTKITYLEY